MKKKLKASLTVEASLALSIFIFGVIAFFVIFDYIRINNIVVDSISYSCEEYINIAYPKNNISSDKDELIGIATDIVNEEYIKKNIKSNLSRVPVLYRLVSSSIDTSESKVLNNNGYIEIKVKYQLMTPFNIIKDNISMSNRLFAHGFVGYEPIDSDTDDMYVYITQNGEVYHLKSDCTYLKIKLTPVSKDHLDKLRNSSGGKYYPCSSCAKNNSANGIYYITNFGNRYHSSATCNLIHRDIQKVKLSQVSNRRRCSKCGH